MPRFLVIVVSVLAYCGLVLAQDETASVSGRVTDPTGAVVIGAEVVATNLATNIPKVTKSNGTGDYSFPNLEPASYRLAVRAPGFEQTVTHALVLHVLDRVTQNFVLKVGSTDETITVTAENTLVNTQDASVGTVIERQTIENMPLSGRSFQGLITLSPGVNTVSTSSNTAGQFVVNGQRSDMNYFTLDGVSANSGSPSAGNTLATNGVGNGPALAVTGGTNSLVSVDALQEFRISTSSFAPEFGRTPGGQISLASRSGSNSFHGDAFDYFRNTALDANDWFLNAAGKPRGVVHQNDFGGVVGGPIIPDKLFFFVSYEGLRLSSPSPSVKGVPTASARALAAAANDNGVVGYMAQFLNAYPLPTGNPSTPCTSTATCVANYTASFPGKSTINSTSGRVDYTLNSKSTLFGRYSHSPSNSSTDNSVNVNQLNFGNDSVTAGWTYAIAQGLVNDARFNFSYTTGIGGTLPLNFSGGLSSIFPSGFAQPGPAGFTLSNMSVFMGLFTGVSDNLTLSPNSINDSNTQVNVTDTLSYVKGAHTLKFGGDFRQISPVANQVSYNFLGDFALGPGSNNLCPGGLPPYICGNATLSNLQHLFPTYYRFNQYSFFGQDTWKVTPRLTLTYGLRWDINPAMEFLNNTPTFSIVPSSFNLNNLSTITAAPLGAPAFSTPWTNIAPRLGIAYQLSDDARWGRVLRAGAGLFYDTGSNAYVQSQGPFSGRVNNTTPPNVMKIVTYPITVANQVFTTAPSPILTPPYNEGTDILVDPFFTLPHVFQMNLTLEQQLGSHQSVSLGYVGSLGRDLVSDLLFPPAVGNPSQFGNGTTGDTLTLFGNFASSSYHSLQTKFQRQFTNGLSAVVSYTWAHSIDNSSLDTSVKTFLPTASQLASNLPATLARASSDFDVRQTFAASAVYEIPTPFKNNVVANAILGNWSLAPIYHYQTAVPLDITAITNGTLGGATGLDQRPNLIPGIPVYVTGSACAGEYQTANPSHPLPCPGGFALNNAAANTPLGSTTAQVLAAGCQTPTASNTFGPFCSPVPLGTQPVSGNLGRNFVRAFPLQQLDFSLHRTFPVYERVHLLFEADMFNVFNHPQFGPFGTSTQSTLASFTSGPNFGLATSMANSQFATAQSSGIGFNPLYAQGGPRNFQFALKVNF